MFIYQVISLVEIVDLASVIDLPTSIIDTDSVHLQEKAKDTLVPGVQRYLRKICWIRC